MIDSPDSGLPGRQDEFALPLDGHRVHGAAEFGVPQVRQFGEAALQRQRRTKDPRATQQCGQRHPPASEDAAELGRIGFRQPTQLDVLTEPGTDVPALVDVPEDRVDDQDQHGDPASDDQDHRVVRKRGDAVEQHVPEGGCQVTSRRSQYPHQLAAVHQCDDEPERSQPGEQRVTEGHRHATHQDQAVQFGLRVGLVDRHRVHVDTQVVDDVLGEREPESGKARQGQHLMDTDNTTPHQDRQPEQHRRLRSLLNEWGREDGCPSAL